MSPSIHPPQAQAGSEKRGGSGGEEYLAYRSLCFAGQQLIWNRPPNISAHTYRNERSTSFLPLFFRWQHDLHFVSGSFSCLICISRSNLHAGARLSDTLVLPALFWLCFLLHLHLCCFLHPPPPSSSTASLLCFCLFMSCPSGGFTSNCCVGNAKRKVRIGPISRISSPSLSISLPPPCSSHFCGFCAASVLRRVCVF